MQSWVQAHTSMLRHVGDFCRWSLAGVGAFTRKNVRYGMYDVLAHAACAVRCGAGRGKRHPAPFSQPAFFFPALYYCTPAPQAFFTQEAIDGIVDTTFGERFLSRDKQRAAGWVPFIEIVGKVGSKAERSRAEHAIYLFRICSAQKQESGLSPERLLL